MTLKATLLALRGGELKFIDVTTNFRLFHEKNVTKFACLQTLKVTCTSIRKRGGDIYQHNKQFQH